MASTVAQDKAYKNHTDSFEAQRYRSYISQESPNVDGPVMEASNPDLIHGSLTSRRLSSPRLSSAMSPLRPERDGEPDPGRLRDKPLSRRSSLPVTSINHLLSSNPPTREEEPQDKVRRVRCGNCGIYVVTHDANGDPTGYWEAHAAAPCAFGDSSASPSIIGENSTSISVTPGPISESSQPIKPGNILQMMPRRFTLEQDPQVEKVEDHRLLCAFCEQWIPFPPDRPYCLFTWKTHKLHCVSNHPKRGPKPGPVTKKVKRESTTGAAVPPEMSASVQVRRTEEERVNFLLADPHATTVEPHRILCAICSRWIQLRKNSTYCTAPWVQHVRKCAARHENRRRGFTTTVVAQMPEQDGEDELDSEDEVAEVEVPNEDVPPKRGRGRPRKRRYGQARGGHPASLSLRAPSGALPSSAPHGNRRSSNSPSSLRSPSPLPNHPYATDMYWYPALPPISSYYSLYAGSQYNESDDSYSLYFHSKPPAQQGGSTGGHSRSRVKLPKSRNPTKSLGSGGAWQGPPLKSLPSSSVHDSGTSPGPDGASSQSGRGWIVWRLKNYSSNTCPMDRSPVPDAHTTTAQRAGSEASGSSSDPLPLYRSGTWPHLMDPQIPNHAQNLSPYIHSETAAMSTRDAPNAPGTHSAHFGRSSTAASVTAAGPSEDPGAVSFNSSAHIPIRPNETYRSPRSLQQLPPSPPSPPPPPPPPRHPASPLQPRPPGTGPDGNVGPRYSADPHATRGHMAPEPPKGIDLDSPECRLAYTFQSIAYLFNTSYQGADDMSLDTLTNFMNRCIPRDKSYDDQEVGAHVGILGERKQLVFTREGGVQLLPPPS